MLVGLDSCVDPVKVLYGHTHSVSTRAFLVLGRNLANIKFQPCIQWLVTWQILRRG